MSVWQAINISRMVFALSGRWLRYVFPYRAAAAAAAAACYKSKQLHFYVALSKGRSLKWWTDNIHGLKLCDAFTMAKDQENCRNVTLVPSPDHGRRQRQDSYLIQFICFQKTRLLKQNIVAVSIHICNWNQFETCRQDKTHIVCSLLDVILWRERPRTLNVSRES